MADTISGDPVLAALWDPQKNSDPADKASINHRPAHWLCPNGHSFIRTPRQLQRNPNCPDCNKDSPTRTLLFKLKPGLRAWWDAEKNPGMKLEDLDASYAMPLWWRCEHGHSFSLPGVDMLKDDACPTCRLAKTSLAAMAPNIAAEWHPTKNAGAPTEVDADHMMSAWWVCPNGHEYQATVRARVAGSRRGCEREHAC